MIVASLLLILVAVTLLVLGLIGGSSPLLISSIVASLLAAVALVIGARQAANRRTAAPARADGDFAAVAPTAAPSAPAHADSDFADAAPSAPAHADGDFADVAPSVLEEPALVARPVRVGADPPPPPESEQAPSEATPFADDPYRAEAYEAGRRDAEDSLAPPDVTETVQPDPDLYAPDAADVSSLHPSAAAGDLSPSDRPATPDDESFPPARADSGRRVPDDESFSPARADSGWRAPDDESFPSARADSGRRAADDPDYDHASSVIGGARASSGTADAEDAAAGRDSGPDGDDLPLFAEHASAGGAGEFGDRADPAGLAEEFGDPDPDDPDDEPLPQKVRPADAVRVARLDAEVLVVDGRPRYHLADCPHLVGRLTEALPAAEAVELGFSPCGLCRPVDRLVAAAAHH
ncbi:MAG: hypothetical protein ABW000_14245 [Actinoplanes sp.]